MRKICLKTLYSPAHKECCLASRYKGNIREIPHQLSGGQQQGVALVGAIPINPGVMLSDQRLSNLDAKIRMNVRTEIRKLQKKLNITSIYVAHDQEEAFLLSDRIVVMNHRKVERTGTFSSEQFFVYRDNG